MKWATCWIHPDQAKAGKTIGVPLNQEAFSVLRKQQMSKHYRRVFTFEGKPVGQVNTKAWRNALKRAGTRTSTGTISAIHGPRGMCCRRERRFMSLRNWENGRRIKWSSDMLTWPRSICRDLWKTQITSQICHNRNCGSSENGGG